ncbi:MAG: FAD-binding oxidoreductase, partial [Blastocatellia bacterium]
LRLGFGTPRDYVIGLRVAHADGTQSKSGGRVVKNVAGYDLNKLYVGSYGTLAIITELTFKLRPLAECSATMMITAKSRAPLLRLADRVLASHLQPASVVFTRRILTRLSPMGPDETLLIRFIDSDPAVEHQISWVVTSIDAECQARVLDQSEAVVVWTEAADFQATGIQVKISVPLSEVTAVLEKVLSAHSESVATADLGAGIIRMEFDADERDASGQIKRLRVVAGAAGGTLFVEKAPAEVRRNADAWGAVGSSEQLMLSMKQRFDPQALLNPGKFVLSI